MTDLDEMERLARENVEYVDKIDSNSAYRRQLEKCDDVIFARAFLAVLPVVRAAVEWDGDTPGPTFADHARQQHERDVALARSIAALRATLRGGG